MQSVVQNRIEIAILLRPISHDPTFFVVGKNVKHLGLHQNISEKKPHLIEPELINRIGGASTKQRSKRSRSQLKIFFFFRFINPKGKDEKYSYHNVNKKREHEG